MVKSKLVRSVYSAISEVITLARRNDFTLIARDSGLFRCYYSNKFETDDVDLVRTLDTLIIIVRGKVTKSILTDEERIYFKSEVNSNNKHVIGANLRDV